MIVTGKHLRSEVLICISFKSCQSARNAINKAERKQLVIKSGKNKKTIKINDEINIQTDGVVLLDFKILGSES